MLSEVNEIGLGIIKLVLAMFFSAVIGLEREAKHRPAGLRTHIIVGIASSLIMSVGMMLKEDYQHISPNVDPARLAAQIISGIGFLGAGTIIKGRDTVYGLTTASTLWAVACVGIAIGAGYYIEAGLSTIAILVSLRVINSFERHYRQRYSRYTVALDIEGPYTNLKLLSRILDSNRVTVDYMHVAGKKNIDARDVYSVKLGLRLKDVKRKEKIDIKKMFSNYDFIIEITDIKLPKGQSDFEYSHS